MLSPGESKKWIQILDTFLLNFICDWGGLAMGECSICGRGLVECLS